MAIFLPGPDRLPAGPRREFLEAMHALYDTAGHPGARVISRDIRRNQDLRETVSHETISAVLRGDSVSSWAKVQSIIVTLVEHSTRDYDIRELVGDMQRLWLAAKTAPPLRDLTSAPWDTPRSSVNRPGLPVRPRLDRTVLAAGGEIPLGQIVGGLPDRNPHFTGREILLDTMRRNLLEYPHAPLVLYGLGGSGKTQLAREYLHLYGSGYSVVWWIQAASAERTRASLISLAERMALPIQSSVEQTVVGMIQRLEAERFSYILVFDGVEDIEIRQLIPAKGGHVVMTSRDPAWAHDPSNNGLEVAEFDHAEAIQFLRKRSGFMSGEEADVLVSTIGPLPLALEQLASLQEATGQPWETLLSQIAEPGADLLSAATPSHYPRTISASLQLALSQLGMANPAALLTFELFAWFGAEPVSIPLLRAGRSGELPPALSRALGDPLLLGKVIADISRYGLARLNKAGQRVAVQPMMRLVLRELLPPDVLDRAKRNVHAILTSADPGWPDDLATLDMHREMAAHVRPSGMIESSVEGTRRTVYHQIRYRNLYGDFQDACDLAEGAVTAWRRDDLTGAERELVLLVIRQLSNALRDLGRYDQARALTTSAWRQLRDDPAFGEDHLHTIAMAAGYAADLRTGGDYVEALNVARDNHARHVRHYGETHELTLLSGHNLAVSLRLVGDFLAARDIDLAVLEQHRTALGTEHSKTMMSANALAEDLCGLGLYRQAIEVLQAYMPARARSARVTERAVLLVRRTAALARRGLGDRAEVVDPLQANYHECVSSFGPDHEHTLAAATSYANALRQAGRHDEAYVPAADAVGAYRRVFGLRNPLTLAAEVNLAAILRAQGELGQARQADVVTSNVLKEVAGEDHPFTIAASINLATDYALAGENGRARQLSKRAHAVAARVYGEEHPVALAASANFAMDLAADGEREVAERRLERVVSALRRTLGRNHPMVVDAAAGLRLECDVEPYST